ncbi:MAG: type IV pilus secretin PilQ [bacterium]
MEKRGVKSIIFTAVFFALITLLYVSAAAYAGQASTGGGEPKYVVSGSKQGTIKSFFVDPADMKVSFDFQNASVADVIRMIAKVSNMNVLIGSDVKGTVTMKMHNVPLKNVMSIIMEAYGLGMVKKDDIYYINSTGTIASVVSAEKKTKEVSEHKITRIVPINYVSATGLMDKVKTVLSSEGKVMYDKSLHSLLISDIPSNVAEATQLIKRLDKRTPEVEIVAKMVEVSKNYSNQLGINWNGSYLGAAPASSNAAVSPNYFSGETTGSPAGPGLSPTRTTQGSPGTFTVGILNSYASINATLQALESLSKAKSIASPKVVVLNNQTATIEKGQTLYLPGVAGVGATAAPQAITAQISLQITPHIMANGNVKLVINSSNNTVAPPVSGAQATLDTESANSTVIIRNGQTVVIGGVYQMSKTVTNNGIPGLMSIPLLGWLFKSRNISYSKDELMIFITPRIINS